mmetsp:Transcript_14116/g.19656  ORF Transcript_14116/g.19656 Transcript_14116/m.19656 type:complete len:492 (+) Transcript_14116:302-1777(+)
MSAKVNPIEAFRQQQFKQKSLTIAAVPQNGQLNPIAAFREKVQQQQHSQAEKNGEETTQNLDANNLDGNSSLSSFSDLPSPAKKRASLGPDLRERSLAMYKNFNNLLVQKNENGLILKVPVQYATSVALEHAFEELQSVGAVTPQEAQLVYKIVTELLTVELLESVKVKHEPNSNQTTEQGSAASAAEVSMQDIQLIDCTALRSLVKQRIAPVKHGKKENGMKTKERNDNLKVEASVASFQGIRKTMEDDFTIIHPLNQLVGLTNAVEQSFYGVYDGHSGRAAAEFCRIHLHINILNDSMFAENPAAAFRNGYLKTNTEFIALASKESNTSGTTAVTILVRQDCIYSANVGDSEAVLCKAGKAHPITCAHLPSKDDEKERIQKSNGTVVWYGSWRVNGLLAVSRSIGDYNLDNLVIAEPYVTRIERTGDEQFIVIGTDGLWDVFTHQEACDFINEKLKEEIPTENIAQQVVDEAMRKKSTDNVTALVIFFN